MRIFVAGATGVLGSRLVPLLRAAGHEVIGTTRTVSKLQRALPVLLQGRVPIEDAALGADPMVTRRRRAGRRCS
jgi:nucleoside-diphosphate-sugar epimerase